MADAKRPSRFSGRKTKVLLVYLFLYFILRLYGEIVQQEAPRREGGTVTVEYIVGGDHTLPRWRRQLYRAFFSPLMVLEEEAWRAADNREEIMEEAERLFQTYWPF